jgi:glycosyltransferase involved in cell wall biosynthesis
MPYISENKQPIRVLHVVGGMIYGGIETWLMQILRHIDRQILQMDFLVHKVGNYDEEIQDLGSKIFYFPYLSNPWLYARKFNQLMRENNHYDIIHSHIHYFNGFILRLAKQANITVRIAHSHTDTSCEDSQVRWYRRLYINLMKSWITNYATTGLANTHAAGKILFGDAWQTDPRCQIFNCGIDLTPFQTVVDPVNIRRELNLPLDAFVIGHVGRFVKVKNHRFLLEISAEVIKHKKNVYLLLVGEGLLLAEIKQYARELGLSDRVIFTGARSDVPRLMLGAMDIFVFPSFYEGLGHVRLEAQAAGLTTIISDPVPQEGDIIPSLVHRLSLSQSASFWAEKILDISQNTQPISQSQALRLVESSPFTLPNSAKNLINIYLLQLALNFGY